MISLLLLGFLLGMRHTLEADHLAAVASITTQSFSTKQAVKQGAVWGLGHTITLFLCGSLVLLFDQVVPLTFAMFLEFAVGLMLCGLGIDVLHRLHKKRVHFHVHHHADLGQHFHAHSHSNKEHHIESAHQHQHSDGFSRRTLMIGFIHGIAGSAALIVLTLQSVDSYLTGLLYIALFGVGSILGMAALSAVVAIPLRHSAKGLTRLHNALQLSIGCITIFIGAALAVENYPL